MRFGTTEINNKVAEPSETLFNSLMTSIDVSASRTSRKRKNVLFFSHTRREECYNYNMTQILLQFANRRTTSLFTTEKERTPSITIIIDTKTITVTQKVPAPKKKQ